MAHVHSKSKDENDPFCNRPNRLSKGVFFLFILSFLLVSCQTLQTKQDTPIAESEYIPEAFNWTPVTPGGSKAIERYDFHNPAVPLSYHIIKIDLDTENLAITSSPSDETEFDADGTLKPSGTARFARDSRSVVAFNTSPFSKDSGKVKIIGTHRVNKREFSSPAARYAALAFDDGKATVIPSQNEQTLTDADFAFGGFFAVLLDGQEQTFQAVTHDSRTGVGVSEDGKTLYVMAVEGENKKKSRGLSYQECAKLFAALGADDALEMDGGSSTQLLINGTSVLPYTTPVKQAASMGFKLAERNF